MVVAKLACLSFKIKPFWHNFQQQLCLYKQDFLRVRAHGGTDGSPQLMNQLTIACLSGSHVLYVYRDGFWKFSA